MPAVADPPVHQRPGSPQVPSPPLSLDSVADPAAEPRPMLEQRVLLEGVSWETFRALRDEPANDHIRMTYDRGRLELLMTVSSSHGEVSSLLGFLIEQFLSETDRDWRGLGDFTVEGEDVARSLEGDESYYIANVEAIRGKTRIDFDAGDPVPDLSVEVVVSNPMLDKPAVYAALGVRELWTWRNDAVTVRTLSPEGAYEESEDSPSLPGFPFAATVDLLRRRAELTKPELRRAFLAALSGE
ncbi:Uma2 family endonuclease [Alienimonas chondri]|uniref:Putative restriction endonuclease domain-containing protein n=1 Tax=Alienimonas chondri TaxID=2681879 RepID=A0ABX1VGW9_9PLAN|nr:Uma2 family endonuclease [Alienimonas chondri]NNJ27373.1 hypothetical protein [Alienimonas chondri]